MWYSQLRKLIDRSTNNEDHTLLIFIYLIITLPEGYYLYFRVNNTVEKTMNLLQSYAVNGRVGIGSDA